MENEEVAPSSNPNPNLLAADPSLQKKHQSMLHCLSNRHQTCLDNSLTHRSAESDSSSSPSFESTSTFLSRFSNSKSSIESQLTQSDLQVKSHLGQISSSISDLEKLVAESSYFLPSYEFRSSLKTKSDLRQNLEVLSTELLPKNKFSFRNKPTRKDPITEPKEEEKEQEPEKKSGFRVPDAPGFWNKKGEILVHNFKGSEVGEFSISDLDSCEVRLMGSMRALFVHKLRNCKVYIGPMTGSVLVDGVEGCVFVMALHQIRIHNAKMSDFYLRVRSRPIIEDSCWVRFAPYCLTYKGIEEELRRPVLTKGQRNGATWMIACGCGQFKGNILFCRRMRDLVWLIFQSPRRVSLLSILFVTRVCLEYKGNILLLYLVLIWIWITKMLSLLVSLAF